MTRTSSRRSRGCPRSRSSLNPATRSIPTCTGSRTSSWLPSATGSQAAHEGRAGRVHRHHGAGPVQPTCSVRLVGRDRRRTSSVETRSDSAARAARAVRARWPCRPRVRAAPTSNATNTATAQATNTTMSRLYRSAPGQPSYTFNACSASNRTRSANQSGDRIRAAPPDRSTSWRSHRVSATRSCTWRSPSAQSCTRSQG